MDLEQFGRQLAAHRDEVEHAMRRTLPVKVGRIAKDHFQDNFRKGGVLIILYNRHSKPVFGKRLVQRYKKTIK